MAGRGRTRAYADRQTSTPDEAPSARSRRRVSDALREAWPDALAALACAIAWWRPDVLGFDLLASAGVMYFVELPLAAISFVAIVRRIVHPGWSRMDKLWFVLIPTLMLAVIGHALLGMAGLLAILWLGGRTLVQLWRDTPATRGDFSGLWLGVQREGRRFQFSLLERRPASPPTGMLIIPAGHAHIMAVLTVLTWIMVMIALLFLPPLGTGGATAAYAVSVGWQNTAIGGAVPAHLAVAAGLLLFGARTVLHFEGTGSPKPPPLRIEEDSVLREVIAKVEGKRPTRSRRR